MLEVLVGMCTYLIIVYVP